MGFYGNITNVNKTSLSFDRVYPNRLMMESQINKDEIYVGRYVLVEYDKDTEAPILPQDFYINEEGKFFASPDFDPDTELQFSESSESSGIGIAKGAYISISDEAEDGSTYYTFYICTGYKTYSEPVEGEDPPIKYASFQKITSTEENTYFANYALDSSKYGNIGKGFDSTVWQKVFVEGEEKYYNIANLNSVVPTFDVAFDGPTLVPTLPHFDTDSTNTYYKLHMQPQWGLRVRCANPADREGKFGETVDTKEYKSDVPVKVGNVNKNSHSGGYNSEFSSYSYPGAIYFNKAGFNKEVRSYDDEGTSTIEILPTGISGQEYFDHSLNPGLKNKAIDTQELKIILPDLGNTISEIWDIVYGNVEMTQSEQRNLDINWNSTEGLRLIQNLDDGVYIDENQVNTIAGCINSVHDLMGMIIEDGLNILGPKDRIYYDSETKKFYIKDTVYEYQPITDLSESINLNYKEISLNDFSKTNLYILKNGNYVKEKNFNENTAYYSVVETEEVQLDPLDFESGIFYYTDINGDYLLDYGYKPQQDRDYYSIDSKRKENNPGTNQFYRYNRSDWFYEQKVGNKVNYIKASSPTMQEGVDYYQISLKQGNDEYVYDEFGNLVPSAGIDLENKVLLNLIPWDENINYYIRDSDKNYIKAKSPSEAGKDFDDTIEYYSLNGINKREKFYEAGKYYYEKSNNYIFAKDLKKLEETTYLTLTTEVDDNIYYVPNKYYYQPDKNNKPNIYLLDDREAFTEGTAYYEKDSIFVLEDLNYKFPKYSIWNSNITEIPEGVTLATRTASVGWKELEGFARELNTIHGLIVQINRIMEFNNLESRSNTTVAGLMNQMSDILYRFDELVPKKLLATDDYGRIVSADNKSIQDFIIKDYYDGSIKNLGPVENAWIGFDVSRDSGSPVIELAHNYQEQENVEKSNDLNINHQSNIKLFNPKVDNAGHIVGSTVETLTLPFAYQQFTDSNTTQGISKASTPYDIFNFSNDEWINSTITQGQVTITHNPPVIKILSPINDIVLKFGDSFEIKNYSYDSKGHKDGENSYNISIPKNSLNDKTSNGADVITGLTLTPETGAFATTRTNIGNLKITGYTTPTSISETISSNDSLNNALGKLKFEIDKERGDRATAITSAINSLNTTDSAVNSQYVSAVNEKNGVIEISRALATNFVLSGYSKATTDEEITSENTLGQALGLLQNQILNSNARIKVLEDATLDTRIKAIEEAGYITATALEGYAKSENVVLKTDYEEKILELERRIEELTTPPANETEAPSI